MAVRRSDAVINESLDLRIVFRYDDSGQTWDPYEITKVDILADNQSTVLETITDITQISQGYYRVTTSASWNTTSRLVYDRWAFRKNAGGSIEYATESTYIAEVSAQPKIQQMTNDLRRMLKDTHPDENKRRYNEAELRLYLDQALLDINVQPPAFTDYTLSDFVNNVPEWEGLIIQGGMIFALISEGIFQASIEFTYNDNGLSINTTKSSKYQSFAQMMMQQYSQMKTKLKQQYYMNTTYPRALVSYPLSAKVRTFSSRMWRVR